MATSDPLVFSNDEDFDADRLNAAFLALNLRLKAQEGLTLDYKSAIEVLTSLGLDRLNVAIQPVYDALVKIAQLGAIFSTASTSAVEVGAGARTFLVAEADRELFAAAAYIAAQAIDDPDTILFGALQSYDRATGALVIGVSQFLGEAGSSFASWRISATAAPDFNATAHSVGAYTQAEVDGAFVAYGKTQTLAPAARALAKKNLRIEQPSFTFATNQVLTATHVGAAIGCDPGCTTLTLPLLSTVENGAKSLIHAYTQSVTVTVDAAEQLGFFARGTANVKSIVIPAQWSLEVVSRGTVWLPRLIPYGYDIPNANFAITFSGAQKRLLKQQIGAGGVIGGITAASSLTAAALNSFQYVNGDNFAIALPPASVCVAGDYIEFLNNGAGAQISLVRPATDTNALFYGNGLSTSSIFMLPGGSMKVMFDGGNWHLLYRSHLPERALSIDAQTFSDAAKKQIYTNLGLFDPVFDCILYRVSDTQLKLAQYNGNRIFIDGLYYKIPSSGLVLSNSGMSANTLYNIYLYVSSGALAIGYTTQGSAEDVTYGHRTINGPSNIWVGSIVTNASGGFSDDGLNRTVLSAYNRRFKAFNAAAVGGGQSGGTADFVIGTTLRMISAGFESIDIGLAGYMSNNSAGNGGVTFIYVNGVKSSIESVFVSSGANFQGPIHCRYTFEPGFGYLTAQPGGRAFGGVQQWNAVWYGGLYA